MGYPATNSRTNDLGDEALLNRAVRASELRDRIRQYEAIVGEVLEVCHQHLDTAVQGYPLVQDIETNGRTVKAMVHVLEEARKPLERRLSGRPMKRIRIYAISWPPCAPPSPTSRSPTSSICKATEHGAANLGAMWLCCGPVGEWGSGRADNDRTDQVTTN
jgi:hypothetical protein